MSDELQKCDKCKKTFNRKYDLERHKNSVHGCVGGSKTNKKLSYECQYCKKPFTRKDSLSRHDKTCKSKTNIKNGPRQNTNHGSKDIATHGDHNKIFANETNNIIKNNYNINLVVFAKDGIQNLTYDELIELFGSNDNLIEALIKIVNLNPNKPQHHNIYYPDLKTTHGEVFEDEKWIKKKIDEILEILIDAKLDDLNDILKDFTYLDKETKKKIRETIEDYDNSKPQTRKKLKTYLKPILYNNKEMIMKTRKINND